MEHELSLNQIKKEWHGSLKAYVIGFFTSLLLTCISFSLVATQYFPKSTLIYIIVALALIQAVIQLIFFLHVGQEPKPRWETLVFYFMLMVLLIIAIGSLWIIYDLNERTMPPMQMEMKHD